MAQKVKIIPCLDMKDGRVVKGVKFVEFKDAGDPVAAAAFYASEGADEIVFLDISATTENRGTTLAAISEAAKTIKTPLVMGGGIRTLDDFKRAFDAGASKVSVNSAAVKRPELIKEAAEAFGGERVVVAIDGKEKDGRYVVCVAGGLEETDLDAVQWAKQAEALGAGEILLTSVDKDGEKSGYDLVLTKAVSDAVAIPVTASGGAGSLEHLLEGVTKGGASALLAASLFHFRELSVRQVKEYLKSKGVDVYA